MAIYFPTRKAILIKSSRFSSPLHQRGSYLEHVRNGESRFRARPLFCSGCASDRVGLSYYRTERVPNQAAGFVPCPGVIPQFTNTLTPVPPAKMALGRRIPTTSLRAERL